MRYTLHTRFIADVVADLRARSVLVDKISASELSRKFIKSVLLVGRRERGGGEKLCGWRRRRVRNKAIEINCERWKGGEGRREGEREESAERPQFS